MRAWGACTRSIQLFIQKYSPGADGQQFVSCSGAFCWMRAWDLRSSQPRWRVRLCADAELRRPGWEETFDSQILISFEPAGTELNWMLKWSVFSMVLLSFHRFKFDLHVPLFVVYKRGASCKRPVMSCLVGIGSFHSPSNSKLPWFHYSCFHVLQTG